MFIVTDYAALMSLCIVTVQLFVYSKTCLKRPLKNRQNKGLNYKDILMKFESIAECSPWSILQYFWPALSENWFWF